MSHSSVSGGAAVFQWNGIPPAGQLLPLGLQHVVAAVVGIITPAILIANTCGLSEAEKTLMIQVSLILTAVDLSGRGLLCFGLDIPTAKVGTFDTELVEEFLLAFVRRADLTLHVTQLAGKNSHHIIEGTFKSLARSLAEAVAVDPRFSQEIPSTKGVL